MLQYITHIKYKMLLMDVMLHEYTRMHTHMQFSLNQHSSMESRDGGQGLLKQNLR